MGIFCLRPVRVTLHTSLTNAASAFINGTVHIIPDLLFTFLLMVHFFAAEPPVTLHSRAVVQEELLKSSIGTATFCGHIKFLTTINASITMPFNYPMATCWRLPGKTTHLQMH